MHLSDQPLDLFQLLQETADEECGALVVFGGTVRLDDGVRQIDYTAHAPIAEQVLREIEIEACKRFAALQCRIVHRLGAVALGELSVLVLVRSPHRPAAFKAAQYAIDELKRRAPVWKEEHVEGGDSRFVEGVPLSQAAS